MNYIKLNIVFFTLICLVTFNTKTIAGPVSMTPVLETDIDKDDDSDLFVEVHTSCHYWQHECYYTGGFNRDGYHRCLRRKGCYRRSKGYHRHEYRSYDWVGTTGSFRRRYYSQRKSCSTWHRRCVRHWGREVDYRGCMRYHRCNPRYHRHRHRHYW